MNRLLLVVATLTLSMTLMVGCAAQQGSTAASSAETSSAASSSASSEATSSAGASSEGGAIAPVASSEVASSEVASSEIASSEFASSEMSTSEMVLGGPSGISEMGVSMQYISSADLLAAINAGDKNKLIIDLRKPADAKAGHIQGAVFAPMNKAVDNNNYADALANLTSTLHDATGNEVGEGRELVLVCYAGKKYAQAATDILNALGADMGSVYTLEGGMTAWTEGNNPVVTD